MDNSEGKNFDARDIQSETRQQATKNYTVAEKDYTKKQKAKTIIIFVIAAILSFAVGAVLFLTIFQPNFLNSQQEKSESEEYSNPELDKIIEIQDTLSYATAREVQNGNTDGESMVAAMDEKIAEIDNEDDRKIAELQKLLILREGFYFETAKGELQKVKEKYPELSETCDFNIHGENISIGLNDEVSRKSYREKINMYCEEVGDGE